MSALLSVDIGTIVYNNVISKSYIWHIKNNTSLVLGLLSNDVEKVRESINNFFASLNAEDVNSQSRIDKIISKSFGEKEIYSLNRCEYII